MGIKHHEYGHILQYKALGSIDALYYDVIGMPSLGSATLDGSFEWKHNNFWTEKWANTLAEDYFGSDYRGGAEYPTLPTISNPITPFFINLENGTRNYIQQSIIYP